ncbi:nucleoside recognition domain-containing protein [Acetivibrio clariflavus]|nr:nucleoside recognition domain-containing protein [Acetivibrio clariflavus]
MLNYIWFGMLVFGIIVGILNGKVDAVTKAVVDSSKSAIELSIGLLGIMCLWTGLMDVAEKSGIIRTISRVVRPVLKFLFPGIPKNHPALGAIVMNLVANFLGLGNAATPLGLKAMAELQKLNRNKDTATNEMSMFLVLNTSCIQLIPATIIAVRSAAGSKNPTEIIGTIWFASVCATIAGIISVKILSAFGKGKVK